MQNQTVKRIHRYLIGKNINRTTLGYRYLIDAIFILIEEGEPKDRKVLDIYQKVADMNCTSVDRVERDIRNSIREMHQTCKQVIYQAAEEIRFMESAG